MITAGIYRHNNRISQTRVSTPRFTKSTKMYTLEPENDNYSHNVAFQDTVQSTANRARSKIVNHQHMSTFTFHSFTAD